MTAPPIVVFMATLYSVATAIVAILLWPLLDAHPYLCGATCGLLAMPVVVIMFAVLREP